MYNSLLVDGCPFLLQRPLFSFAMVWLILSFFPKYFVLLFIVVEIWFNNLINDVSGYGMECSRFMRGNICFTHLIMQNRIHLNSVLSLRNIILFFFFFKEIEYECIKLESWIGGLVSSMHVITLSSTSCAFLYVTIHETVFFYSFFSPCYRVGHRVTVKKEPTFYPLGSICIVWWLYSDCCYCMAHFLLHLSSIFILYYFVVVTVFRFSLRRGGKIFVHVILLILHLWEYTSYTVVLVLYFHCFDFT